MSLYPLSSTNEVNNDEVEDDMGEDEVGESSLRADTSELGLVGWVHLDIQNKT